VLGPFGVEAAAVEGRDVRAPGAGGAIRTVDSELGNRRVCDESEASAEASGG